MRPIYFNRELSWLDFNTRVLEEALRSELAALERYKFLTIVSSNFDEFFMVRMAAIKRTTLQNNARHCYNGAHNIQYNITENHASKKLCRKARKKTQDIIKRQYNCLMNDVFPTLAKNGLQLVSMNKWDELQKQFIKKYVIDKVFPYLNPLSLKSKTHISGETLYAAFLLHQNEERKNIFEIVIVKIPDCRIIMLPYGGDGVCRCFLLEQAVQYFAPYLFPGCFIKESMLLKIDREADFSIDNENNENFIKVMEKVIVEREYSRVIRMTYSAGSKFLRDEFARHLKLEPDDIYLINGPLHLANLASLYDIGIERRAGCLPAALRPAGKSYKILRILPVFTKYPAARRDPHIPNDYREEIHSNVVFFDDRPVRKSTRLLNNFNNKKNFWRKIKQKDMALYFPYESFNPVLIFFSEAARDPSVLSVKVTLYRTSGDSPIVKSLKEAALKGKKVTVIVELKARFNEERNINWAKDLERAGVNVIYGFTHIKVHAKIALVTRREAMGICSYLHLSTGNYNEMTAKTYADICLFTADKDFVNEAEIFFEILSSWAGSKNIPCFLRPEQNAPRFAHLTGDSPVALPAEKLYNLCSAEKTRHLITAPVFLKKHLIALIERETRQAAAGGGALIKAKMNSLADADIINALYRASRAGVKIFLNIRGICMLIPGVHGLSENIKVVSIIDHFLEHSRIIFFENSGNTDLYLSSADWMTRSFENRVELMFPVIDKEIKKRLCTILDLFFKDNCHSYNLGADGVWRRLQPGGGENRFRVQEYFYKTCGLRNE